ncbi:MAG: FHA domain-containing protein, partial [Cryomorphaceae bacterium]|nr:FHA domain-containing protein [Cryomorphaceae bacterium]
KWKERERQTTNKFIIRDEFDNRIMIHARVSELEIGKRYKVDGIIYVDRNSNQPYISAHTVQCVNCEQQGQNVQVVKEVEYKTSLWLYIVIGVMAILLIIIVFSMKKAKKPAPSTSFNKPNTSFDANPGANPNNEFKTIRIHTDNIPKTMRFIPGTFVITSGLDQGKQFKLAAEVTSQGYVATVGRGDAKPGSAHSHIKLSDMTVSQNQAKIIESDGKVWIENLGNTNPTVVNGRRLAVNDKELLTEGSQIKFGNIEMAYKA